MRRAAFLLIAMLLGAGCSSPATNYSPRTDQTGLALITKADSVTGPSVSTIAPSVARRLTTVLPPTFRDGNGVYIGRNERERITIQLGVAGTPEDDRNQFRAIPELEQFDEGALKAWHLIVAYDRANQRWVARASVADMKFSEPMYHVIECVASSDSERAFWEGCRSMIENANVTVIPGNTLENP